MLTKGTSKARKFYRLWRLPEQDQWHGAGTSCWKASVDTGAAYRPVVESAAPDFPVCLNCNLPFCHFSSGTERGDDCGAARMRR